MSGPTVVAIDQVDALIDEVAKDGDPGVVREVATGLMALRDTTHRTFTIISCLPESWDYLADRALDTVMDRFRAALPDAEHPDRRHRAADDREEVRG